MTITPVDDDLGRWLFDRTWSGDLAGTDELVGLEDTLALTIDDRGHSYELGDTLD